MTPALRQAYETLVKHELFYRIYSQDKYIPRAQEPAMNEITAAYKIINPEFFKGQSGCQGCGASLIVESDRARRWYLENNQPKKYEF